MKNLAYKIFLLLILTTFSLSLFSQPRSEKIRARIQTMKKVKLLDVLELDEATSEKLLIKYNTYEDKFENKLKEFDDVEQKLEDAVKSGNSSVINETTQKFLEIKTEITSISEEKDAAIREILSDQKFAIYLIFEKRFRKELSKELIKRGRRRRN